jgi:hypothetical protein
LLHKRDKLFKKWRSNLTSISVDVFYESYQKAKNLVKYSLKKARDMYLWNLGCKSDGHGNLWKYIHKKKGLKMSHAFKINEETISDPQVIADSFAKMFSENYNKQPVTSDFLPRSSRDASQNLTQIIVDREQVCSILKSLKAKTAPGPDKIPPRILKTCAVELSASLNYCAFQFVASY